MLHRKVKGLNKRQMVPQVPIQRLSCREVASQTFDCVTGTQNAL